MKDVAIVGGGPAGALCGEKLARAGFAVTIFDEKLAWEKPCGGGLTHKAIERYPFLLDSPYPKKLIRHCDLISSQGHRARLELDHPIVIYSRKVLNGLLLERAQQAGCAVVHGRVTKLETQRGRVQLAVSAKNNGGSTNGFAKGAFDADFAVVAAGARNPLLPGTTPLAPADLELTVGYFIPAQENVLKVKFLQGFEGYLWSFPRADHLSTGICGKMRENGSRQLKERLHEFMRAESIPVPAGNDGCFYSHVLPSPSAVTLRSRRVVGPKWGLVGDAAAWVDPLTGEGLFYAMRSGDLLAESLIRGCPQEYPQRVREEFRGDLELAVRMARRFFCGRFLGGAVTTRMIQFVAHSPAFRALMRDVFSGAQNYRSLKRRLWAQLGVTLSEVLAGLIAPRRAGAVEEVR